MRIFLAAQPADQASSRARTLRAAVPLPRYLGHDSASWSRVIATYKMRAFSSISAVAEARRRLLQTARLDIPSPLTCEVSLSSAPYFQAYTF